MSKFTIYQVLPRLFGNTNDTNKVNGSIEENGCGKFNGFSIKALKEIKALGISHIWYTGIIEHATQTDYTNFGIRKDHPSVVKGKAGSPYAIKDYYDVDPDLAVDVKNRMNEFQDLVTRTHTVGMKVIIDFIPNHVAREYYSDAKPINVSDLGENDNNQRAFSAQNNFYYLPGQKFNPSFELGDYEEFPAKATGNDQFTASPGMNDWYETIKLNYGVDYSNGQQHHFDPIPDTWIKMCDILLFWSSKNVDGFRCDMAEMVPVEFWHWAILQVKKQYPHVIFIAEIYNPAQYRNYISNGKFDFLYDKVGMYDKLRDIVSRNHSARDITYAWQALNGIEDNMLHFLENHDEQRIGSGFFSGNGLYAKPAMIVAATLTKAPVMIYFGQELGEQGMKIGGFSGMDGRTTIFDYHSVDSVRDWVNGGEFNEEILTAEQKELRHFYKKLLNISLTQNAITKGEMFDLQYFNVDNHFYNSNKQYAYFRKFEDELLLFILNFDDKIVNVEVKIPAESYQYLTLKEGDTYSCKNLLDEVEVISNIKLSTPFQTQINAWTGKIIKLKTVK